MGKLKIITALHVWPGSSYLILTIYSGKQVRYCCLVYRGETVVQFYELRGQCAVELC